MMKKMIALVLSMMILFTVPTCAMAVDLERFAHNIATGSDEYWNSERYTGVWQLQYVDFLEITICDENELERNGLDHRFVLHRNIGGECYTGRGEHYFLDWVVSPASGVVSLSGDGFGTLELFTDSTTPGNVLVSHICQDIGTITLYYVKVSDKTDVNFDGWLDRH
jgi:hypothetical protein